MKSNFKKEEDSKKLYNYVFYSNVILLFFSISVFHCFYAKRYVFYILLIFFSILVFHYFYMPIDIIFINLIFFY